jgi:hypothetical protein
LYYYLKDKEILPQKPYLVVLLKWCNHLAELKGKSTEEIVNNVIDMHIKKACKNPDFYRFLFEMSCLSSHSKKVYNEFIICQDKVIDAIVNWLEDALDKGIVHFKPGKAKYIAKIMLYVTDGVAFHMIDRPNTINDKGLWDELRNSMIDILNIYHIFLNHSNYVAKRG